MDTSEPQRTFQVEFTPDKHWGLVGSGELVAGPDTIVLRGLKGRLSAAPTSYSIPRADIVNVIQDGRLVQCQVNTWPLLLRAADPAAAAELAALLPTEGTREFLERVALDESLRRINARAVVTPTLVGLNCLVFVCMAFAGANLFVPDPNVMIEWGSNFGPRTLGGEWWRLLTSTFLHWGVIHLAFNMWALWSIGRQTELLFGSLYFLALYVFAGLCGGIVELLWHPSLNSAGASGAIFGVMGGLVAFVFKPTTRIPPSVATPTARSALFFIGYNLLNGFTHAGISNGAHLGGLLSGAALGWFLARPLDPEQRRQPARRLLLTCLGAAAALYALSWPLTHPQQ
jgi:rhomboid protease GluP